MYLLDHLGSIREMTDSSGVLQAQYLYDPFGRITNILTGSDSDFQYARYYVHLRSGFYLTAYRMYSSKFGKWINRDPIGERGGVNLTAYVGNSPISTIDRLGLDPFTSLAGALTNICMNPKCKVQDVAKCLADAQNIANTMMGFYANFSNPANAGSSTDAEAINGYFCYDWAAGIAGAIASTGQTSFNQGYDWFIDPEPASYNPDGAANYHTHWAASLSAGDSPCPECTVHLDDAFGHGFGSGEIHAGPWEPPAGWLSSPNAPAPGQPYTPKPIQAMPWSSFANF